MTSSFFKDPDAKLDFTEDWTLWLAPMGDQILSSTWIIPGGLTQTSSSNTATTTTVWLSGGVLGTNYVITNRINTTQGRIEDRSFTVFVKDR